MKTIELLTVNPGVDELLALAQKESGLRLTRSGQSIAEIIPLMAQPRKRTAPLHPDAWQAREDFDQPLPEGFWLGKE
jgi:antitoxin (DNA-binding transcriptional repressor) of toxin-antitoxin stability system